MFFVFIVWRMQTSTSAVEETISSPFAWSYTAEGLCRWPGADQGLDGALAGSITCLGSSSPQVRVLLKWECCPEVRVFSKRSVMLQLLLSTSVFTVVAEIIKDTLCVLCLTWRKGNWSCMFSSVFCSSHLVFQLWTSKTWAKHGHSLWLSNCLRAHFACMDCSVFHFGTVTPKSIPTGLENSLASSEKPSINSFVRYFLVVPFHLVLWALCGVCCSDDMRSFYSGGLKPSWSLGEAIKILAMRPFLIPKRAVEPSPFQLLDPIVFLAPQLDVNTHRVLKSMCITFSCARVSS